MGRKSLLTSTTKKKAATRKKKASKKSAETATIETAAKKSEAKKKSVSKKPAAKAVSVAKVTAGVTKPPATKAKAKKTAIKEPSAKKAPVAKKQEVTLKDLLFKRFVVGKTASKPIKVEKTAVKIAEAPGFVSGYGKEQTEKIRRLLFQAFDLKAAVPEPKKEGPIKDPSAKKVPVAKKQEVTLKDLLFKRFVVGKTASKPIKVEKTAVKIAEAPGFVSGYGKEQTEKIRRLLFQAFDLKAAVPEPKKEGPIKKPSAKKAPVAKKQEVTLKDLLFKQFVVGKTAAKPIKVEKTAVKIPEAPGFVSGYGKEQTEKIRRLLFQTFDLQAEAPVNKTEDVAVKPVPTPVPPYEPPTPSAESSGPGSMNRAMRMGLYALALLIAIIVGTSFSNRNKFYLKQVDSGVEVWRGKFAPAGAELVYKLDGMTAPIPLRESYTQKEISPILFGFFLDKADVVLNVPAGPDIAKMKEYLRQAVSFAPSVALQNQVQRRLKGVDFIVAFHKADVALAKGTMPDLRVAKASLSQAYSNATTDSQRELVEKTQVLVDEAMAVLKTK